MRCFALFFFSSLSAFALDVVTDINSDNLEGFRLDQSCDFRDGGANRYWATIPRAPVTLNLKGLTPLQIDIRGPISSREVPGPTKEEACRDAWSVRWVDDGVLRDNIDTLKAILSNSPVLQEGVCAKPFIRIYGSTEDPLLGRDRYRIKFRPVACN